MRSLWNRIGWWALVVFLAGCQGRERSNLLLITLDTTRADHLGCYGYDRPTSPNLDALAAEGVLFRRVSAQAAVTPVSHASILTGLHPYHHGLRALHGFRDLQLLNSAPTLAEILQTGGYETAAFVSAFPAGSRFGLDRGFRHFDEEFPNGEGTARIDATGIVNTAASQRRADETTNAVIRWLDRDPPRPFFLWVHYFDPHDPRLVPPAAYLKHCGVTPGTEKDRLISLYDCEIFFVDAQVGRLLSWLKSHRLDRRTLVVVTADHGEGLGDHDWWSHGILYREQIHLPLILRHGSLPRGRRVGRRARSIDITPTILDILETDLSGEVFDGESLLPDLLTGEPGPDRDSYSESRNLLSYAVPHSPGLHDRKDDEFYSIIRERWKYIHHRRRPEESELFDLEEDPGEKWNRFSSESERVREFLALLERDEAIFAEGMITPPPAGSRERLRSLGYVD